MKSQEDIIVDPVCLITALRMDKIHIERKNINKIGKREKMKRIFAYIIVFLFVVGPFFLSSQEEPGKPYSGDKLFELSLEELMNVKIISRKKTLPGTWALVILKMISLDRNIDRLGDPIRIGVDGDKILDALQELEPGLRIWGRRFTAHRIRTLIEARQYRVVFISGASGLGSPGMVEQVARSGCLVFSDDARQVLFGFTAVMLTVIDNRTYVAVNLDNASRQGALFKEEDLEMVTIVHGGW